MKTLAIVTHRRLDGERSGSKTYLYRMMTLIKEAGYSLTIVILPTTTFSNLPWAYITADFQEEAEIIWPGAIKFGNRYITFSVTVWARFIRRLGRELLRKAKIGPKRWHSIKSNLAAVPPANELEIVASHLKKLSPDAVMVEYSSLGPLLRLLPDNIGKSLILHDSFAAREEQFATRGEPSDYPDPPTLNDEALRMVGTDHLYHASLDELEQFKGIMAASCQHLWFRPTAPVFREATKARETAELLYIGGRHKGSLDAINHFLEEIWPLVLSNTPTTKLNIVGPIGFTIEKSLLTNGVKVWGLVDDLTEFSGPDMIGLLPTRLQSGISIKVGEYLGLGLPIVTYPVGISGFGDLLNGVVHTCASTNDFANKVVELLKSPQLRQKTSDVGLHIAETDLQNPEIVEALKRLGSGQT